MVGNLNAFLAIHICTECKYTHNHSRQFGSYVGSVIYTEPKSHNPRGGENVAISRFYSEITSTLQSPLMTKSSNLSIKAGDTLMSHLD